MKDYLKNNPWAEIYAFMWYNSNEIWNYTQEDWNRRAKELQEDGITTVMTFSVTHYRMSYYPYWTEINECLRKMVKACHKYGIKVVEHHSSHLTSRLDTEHGWKRFEENQRVRNGKYDDWKKVFPYLSCSRMIDGKKIDDMSQIDGRTGKIADNVYGTYSLCFNNPDYREVYFNYMKEVIATGIDGIMNDDIQYFADENACACEHCRKLFKEQTGYYLPEPDEWDDFFGNYENPAYIAWKKFKFDSTSRMYYDLTKFYKDLGVELIRPNYTSHVIVNNTSYSFERCNDLWSVIMQENCFSAIDKQSYLAYYFEAVHRYAAARRYGVPSLSVFYPEAQDSVYFTWALAKSWGQLFSGTYEGKTASALERVYRAFERENMRYYTAPDKISDVSFYFSLKTRDYTEDAAEKYMFKLAGQMQAAYVSGLGVDMVFENDSVEELLRHKNVVMSYVAMVGDEELKRLAEFVCRGGRLIILGDFARFKEDGSARGEDEVQAKFGVEFKNDQAVKCGDGEIWRMSFEPEGSEFQSSVWANHWTENVEGAKAQLSKWKRQNAGTGAVLKRIVGEPEIVLDSANDRTVVSGYVVDGALAIHILNLSDTIPEEPCKVSHSDEIKNFTSGGDKLPESKLKVKIPQGIAAKKAVLRSPELSKEIELGMVVCNGVMEITIPGNEFSGYALVALE